MLRYSLAIVWKITDFVFHACPDELKEYTRTIITTIIFQTIVRDYCFKRRYCSTGQQQVPVRTPHFTRLRLSTKYAHMRIRTEHALIYNTRTYINMVIGLVKITLKTTFKY